jgi:hypothetical protein
LTRLKSLITPSIFILVTLSLLGLLWANYTFAGKVKGGKDFTVYWVSARTLLFDGATPYGELASLKSQNLIYGLSGRPGDPPSKLDLPFHIETIFVPLSLIPDFQWARAIWMTILELSLVTTIFISLYVSQWSPNPIIGTEIFLFVFFSVYGLWAIIQGNAAVLAGLFAASALWALHVKQDELAGILLALTTFKWFSVGIWVAFILIWLVFQKRWRPFIPFVMTLVILILVSFFFLPNWFLPYVRAVVANLKFGDWLSPAVILKPTLPYVGERLGWILSGALIVLLLLEWWLARKKEFRQVLWTSALTLAITPLIGFPSYIENFVLLIIPLLYSLSILARRQKTSSNGLISTLVILFFLVSWATFLLNGMNYSVLYLEYPLFVLVLLYWVRWWTVKSPRMVTPAG